MSESTGSTIHVKLPDGTVKEFKEGVTSMDVAMSISEGLARNVLAAKVNGEVTDASRPIEKDSTVQLLTWNDKEGKSTFWHSSAHLMAEALEALADPRRPRRRQDARRRRMGEGQGDRL